MMSSPDRERLVDAIRRSWARDTCSEPEHWHPDNPAVGHCDVSSFVLWEHLGGDLVLAQVFVDGELTEHHYWNRVDGADLDVTREQFDGCEEIREVGGHTGEELAARRDSMHPALAGRIATFRERVDAALLDTARFGVR